MVDQERSDICVVFTMSPCTPKIKQTFVSLLVSNHAAFKLAIQALRIYMKLTCEYEFHILSNVKFSASKHHAEYYIKVRPPLVSHFCVFFQ